MESVDIRHGSEFHFVSFFCLSILLPVNVFVSLMLPMDAIVGYMIFQVPAIMVLGLVLSIFPGFRRFLQRNLEISSKQKMGFWKQVKGYLKILMIELHPMILLLLKLLPELIKELKG